jgi:hypothetical protein
MRSDSDYVNDQIRLRLAAELRELGQVICSSYTPLESQILTIVQRDPDRWFDCHQFYLGEVLALQCKGLVESRLVNDQIQIRKVGTASVR